MAPPAQRCCCKQAIVCLPFFPPMSCLSVPQLSCMCLWKVSWENGSLASFLILSAACSIQENGPAAGIRAHHTLVWLLSVSLTHQTSPPFRNGSPLHLLPTWLLMEEDGSHWGMQRTCSHFIPCSTSSPPSLCLSLVPPLSLLPMAPPLLFPLWGGAETGKNMKGVQCPQMA